jgi:hypothetical protein
MEKYGSNGIMCLYFVCDFNGKMVEGLNMFVISLFY